MTSKREQIHEEIIGQLPPQCANCEHMRIAIGLALEWAEIGKSQYSTVTEAFPSIINKKCVGPAESDNEFANKCMHPKGTKWIMDQVGGIDYLPLGNGS